MKIQRWEVEEWMMNVKWNSFARYYQHHRADPHTNANHYTSTHRIYIYEYKCKCLAEWKRQQQTRPQRTSNSLIQFTFSWSLLRCFAALGDSRVFLSHWIVGIFAVCVLVRVRQRVRACVRLLESVFFSIWNSLVICVNCLPSDQPHQRTIWRETATNNC